VSAPATITRRLLGLLGLSAALALATLLADRALHAADLAWIGRYLGIPGTLLIASSLLYSLRKRRRIATGSPRGWLAWHQFAGWLGSWLVLVHAGVHFHALLPWLATLAMGLNVISGMVGKFLVLPTMRAGASDDPLEAASRQIVKRWRQVHLPVFFTFAALALLHILSVLALTDGALWTWPPGSGAAPGAP
jgi:hypothetical protein